MIEVEKPGYEIISYKFGLKKLAHFDPDRTKDTLPRSSERGDKDCERFFGTSSPTSAFLFDDL